jgi:TP901 family phage tail tape measure protein
MAFNALGLGMVFTARDLFTPVVARMTRQLTVADSLLRRAGRTNTVVAASNAQLATSTRAVASGLRRESVAAQTTAGSLGKYSLATRGAAESNALMTAALPQLIARFGLLGAGALGVMGVFKASGFADNFNQQLVAAGKIMGATAEDLGMLEEKVLDVGLRTKFSPDEIVEGIKNMGGAGLQAAEAAQAIEPAALLATAGQIQLDQATNALVGTLKSYQLEADQAGMVADKLTRITQLSNLQARDFEVGLSKAAAVAGKFGVSIDDTLVSLGLLRNLNIDASSAGTALRTSIMRLSSDQKAINKVVEQGVDVFDKETKALRPIGDIMFDLSEATKDLTEEERNLISQKVFGRRGILAFGAAEAATFKTMRDGRMVTLKGREAFEAMRLELEKSVGAATEFNDALLNTAKGQREILSGAVDTLKVVIGQGFTQITKPIVRFVAESVGALAKFIKDLDPQTKKAVALVMAVASALTLVAGLFVALGSTASLVLVTLVGSVAAFTTVVRRNVGGLGTFFKQVFEKIRLFAKGFAQLITDGFLSGDTLEALMTQENRGVLTALGVLVQLGYRFQRLWEGIMAGFGAGIEAAQPAFDALVAAVRELGGVLGITGGEFTTIQSSSDRFRVTGEKIGAVLAGIVEIVTVVLTVVTEFATGFIIAVQDVWASIQPAVQSIREGFAGLVDSVTVVLEELGLFEGGSGDAMSVVQLLGEAVGRIVTAFAGPFTTALAFAVNLLARFWGAVGTVIQFVKAAIAFGGDLVNFFKVDLPAALELAVEYILGVFDPVVELFDKILEKLGLVQEGSRSIAERFGFGGEGEAGAVGSIAVNTAAALQSASLNATGGAEAEATARQTAGRRRAEETAEAISSALSRVLGSGSPAVQPVQLLLDGEVLAEVMMGAQERRAAGDFSG